ncbi:biotin transporter BioY [Nocardioides sp.]|uniref:biotin transporter BioY n=1 Tax=Nocardioides sp. TaxID=35761 RepID=UPI002ED7C59C
MTMAETADTPTTADAPAAGRRSSTTDIALIAAFAALIAACAYIGGIPVGGGQVAITLQTFGVMLAGALLGPWRGFLAVSLYLGLGAAGLPVFSEHSSGLGTFTSISAGYLWSFPVAALLTGLLVQYVARGHRTAALWVFLCAVPGMVVNHIAGAFGMKVFADISWQTAFTWDAPYWLGDIVKILVVALVAAEVHKAFPHLLRRG